MDTLSTIHNDGNAKTLNENTLEKLIQREGSNNNEARLSTMEVNENDADNDNTDYADLLRLVNSGMIKHFGYEDEDEDSVNVSDNDNGSDKSRHIDQSMVEEDK